MRQPLDVNELADVVPREAEPGDTITIDAIDTDKNEASRKGFFTKVSTLSPRNC